MASDTIKPLPPELVEKYRAWREREFDSGHFAPLADSQSPDAMVISCCDSRMNVTDIFGAKPGELFVHRNIANIVPPIDADTEFAGTAAALEYAVKVLGVKRILVLGHSNCGGVRGGYHLSGGTADAPVQTDFIRKWLALLKPVYERCEKSGDDKVDITAMEKLSVEISLENLMGYPFIAEACGAGTLTLHGLWHDIGTGVLFGFDGKQFEEI